MDEMKSLEEMRIEIEVLRKELEFQTKLVEFWEERCKQEFVEKMELWNKNLEMKKKYEGVLEELQEKKNSRGCDPLFKFHLSIFLATKLRVVKETPIMKKGKRKERCEHEFVVEQREKKKKKKENSQANQAVTCRVTCGYCGKFNHTEIMG